MILCHKHRFLFIHIYKNAGTSIKRALRPFSIPTWQKYANSVIKRIGFKKFGSCRFEGHITSAELIEKIGRDEFDSHFSFAIVRNPWDWEVSHYKYILQKRKHPSHRLVRSMKSFSEYLHWRCDNRYRLQNDFLSVDGQRVVNFVGRFENLQEDFRTICERIGIQARLVKKNSTRPKPYQDFYDSRTAELVRQTYRRDIETFGYEFEKV